MDLGEVRIPGDQHGDTTEQEDSACNGEEPPGAGITEHGLNDRKDGGNVLPGNYPPMLVENDHEEPN